MIVVMYLVSVVIVSVTFITQVEANSFSETQNNASDDGIIGSDGSVDGVKSITENNLSEELETEPGKRLKKSYYSEPPCDFCGYNKNGYEPTIDYGAFMNLPNSPAENYYNFPAKSNYPHQMPPYLQPIYNAPSYPLNINQPNYQWPSYQSPSYQSPSYQSPSYQSPSYQSPSYQQPNYQQPSYQQPSYQSLNYQPPDSHSSHPSSPHSQSHLAPSYHSQSYNGRNYQQPTFNSYSNSRHSNVHPSDLQRNILSSKLLVGCNPHVSRFPDRRYLSQPHSQPEEQTQPSYRFSSSEHKSTSDLKHTRFNSNEIVSRQAADNSTSKTVPVKGNSSKIASTDESKKQQQETLLKMAQYHDQLIKNRRKNR